MKWKDDSTTPPFILTDGPLIHIEYTTHTKKQHLDATAIFYTRTMIYKNNDYGSPGICIFSW